MWSITHSTTTPHLVASAGSDGTCKIWSGPGLAQRAHCLEPGHGAAICSASFCSADANLIALAGADSCAYIYDLRSAAQSLHVSIPYALLVLSKVSRLLYCHDGASQCRGLSPVAPAWHCAQLPAPSADSVCGQDAASMTHCARRVEHAPTAALQCWSAVLSFLQNVMLAAHLQPLHT